MSIAERWKGHPPLPSDLGERLPRVVDRLRAGGAELVYLFGSLAESREPERAGDLDLAVWGLEEDRWSVLADVSALVGTDRVDLIILEQAPVELRYRVVSTGRLLHSESAKIENRVEMSILRQYHDIAPFRATQARYVRERHSGYGS